MKRHGGHHEPGKREQDPAGDDNRHGQKIGEVEHPPAENEDDAERDGNQAPEQLPHNGLPGPSYAVWMSGR